MAIAEKGLSDKLSAFLRDQAWRDDSKTNGSAQIVCLRGCRINKDGSLSAYGDPRIYTDRYDDVMVVYGRKAGGQRYLETFRASAKPGLAWVKHPNYAGANRGCPTVQPGQYKYQRGDHRGHQAMRQAGYPVVVIRDLDQDARLELTDLVDYPVWTGINIHAGGASERVGLNSSGCQVVWGGWGGAPWRMFHSFIYKVARDQKLFHYAVADFMDFARWHDNPNERKGAYSILRFGSYGARVKELQALLGKAGYYGSALVDGEFGRVTDEGVRVFQRKKRLPVDGAVTQKMLTMLRGA